MFFEIKKISDLQISDFTVQNVTQAKVFLQFTTIQGKFIISNFALKSCTFNDEVFQFDTIGDNNMYFDNFLLDKTKFITDYMYARGTYFVLPMKFTNDDRLKRNLMLHDTTIQDCEFNNFGFVYSTI